ncbi:hypothetical protein [Sphingomonas parapaucimobilis]|uniref:hypothetical protein n=1 Tax=Sphingomonas parapaucimobilis TaxID=28213 RepID=UPI00321A6DB8
MKKTSIICALLIASASCVDAKPAAAGHYTEYTCTFGKYGRITVHKEGIDHTYIIVRGKKYPATGGVNFIASDDDDSVGVMFDRKGNLSYGSDGIPGKDCRTIRR